MKNSNSNSSLKNDLLTLALKANEKTARKSKKNVCDYMHEIIFEQNNQNINRSDLVVQITLLRIKDNSPELYEALQDKFADIESDERKAYEAEKITVTNGVDAAVCNGHTSASYCSNEKYADFELIKTQRSQVLSIAKRK